MFLTTEAVVANIPEPESNDNAAMGGMLRYDVKTPINVDISMFCVFTGHNLVIEI